MIHSNSDCEIYEPLISAMIDGELSSNQQEELRGHVDECRNCRDQLRYFEQVNLGMERLCMPAHPAEDSSVPKSLNGVPSLSKPLVSRNRFRSWMSWRLVPIAVVASLLVCIGIVVIQDQKPAAADQVPAEQFVQPMKDFLMSNLQQKRDQELMLRTLSIDLRSLKLEINQLEPGSTERLVLEAQIDSMIEKVMDFRSQVEPAMTQFEANNPINEF